LLDHRSLSLSHQLSERGWGAHDALAQAFAASGNSVVAQLASEMSTARES
jgi:hypothetical protein